MQYYVHIIEALEQYFDCKNWQRFFLEGGCFWLARTLKKGIPESYIMINRVEEHCALFFERGLYDVRGRISTKNFSVAKEKDIQYMEKHYIPRFDVISVEKYLFHEYSFNEIV